jgi:hypothetical protein
MKKLFISMVVLGAIALMPNRAQAQTTTSAAANIVAPISLTQTATLDFGTVSVSASTGTCVLTAAGGRSATGGVTLSSATPASHPAAYTVGGQGTLSYAITLPGSAITVTESTSGSSNTMTIDNFTSSKTGNVSSLTGGADNFTVGATLNAGASQYAAAYTGSFNISVAYN